MPLTQRTHAPEPDQEALLTNRNSPDVPIHELPVALGEFAPAPGQRAPARPGFWYRP